MIRRLPPFFANVQKRLTKSPKMDLLLGAGRRLVAVEIKLSTTVERRDLAGLRQCMKDLALKRAFLIANCEEPRQIGRDVRVIPWRHLAKGGEVAGLP